MKHIKMNKKGWQIVDEQIRQAKKDGHVAWTVHHEDGTVTLEISGVATLKLVKNLFQNTKIQGEHHAHLLSHFLH